MITFFKYLLLLLVVVLVQSFVFDNLVLPMGIVAMFYLIFILNLPFRINKILLLLLAFGIGLSVDALNDTYGLHTSSVLFMAFMRDKIFKTFEPIAGFYENKSLAHDSIPLFWYVKSFGTLILLFSVWFYFMSVFRISGFWFTLQKALLSAITTFAIIFIVQILLRRKESKDEQ